ncbi:exosome complex component RRP45, putative [Plasmodium berghei]|uniref:Exosome complex component RRP45, putative n=2 Tax=Plasmodium berghei TaxID=5821 RepID=A0A509AMY8_PLABA|nr:exosome complex component RRP45, putative [Plasmodium berghei ANKA]SCM24211.1 exosome complex component RRP45, putative [Plasmodium berghei]SCN26994.1 exosome complex component RRP45, putative [Plasmodium berghei]SCO63415.1 exosome complex component RRP45, putative [Plasmodium berghei]VUC56824.1 exosome complex component RRP45, putative [Plasmodium berghei ANKA]|eukprot:XP_034422610.1 exosome complex component RRP45, putative [Plasmodium berghei ANKA]
MKACKNNTNFFWCNLKNKLRLDGRNFEDSRNVSIYFLGDYGNVEVSIGNTKVVCKITSEIVKPYDKKPNEGIIKINLDVESFNTYNDISKISDECLEIKNLIERIFKASNILNFESLCIIPYKKVWCLLINITVIENDGNLYDSCYLSAYSALLHFRNSSVDIDNTGNVIIDEEEVNYTSLSVHNSPILTTFAYFNFEEICLIDPSLYEEEFMSSKLSIAINKNENLISILKPGGLPISYDKILQGIELAKKRVKSILKILKDALKEDNDLRNNLKKKNLHIKYSSNPVHIKYDGDDIVEKSLDVTINQMVINNLNIEKIVKKYEQYILSNGENINSIIGKNNIEENKILNDTLILNKQYDIDQELRRMKEENIIKSENYFHRIPNYNNNLNIHPNENYNNKNINNTKIKRQEFEDNKSNIHTMKIMKSNNIKNNEEIKFSSTISQDMQSKDSHYNLMENKVLNSNFENEKKNIKIKEQNKLSNDETGESSDIDFSVAINQNLKKHTPKKK